MRNIYMDMADEIFNAQYQIYPGDIFSGIITYVVDQKTFYIVKSEFIGILKQIQDYLKNNVLDKMFWYPSNLEVFFINIDEECYRAKRISFPEESMNHLEYMQILLIDIGEVILVPLLNSLESMDIFFSLPEQFKDIHALARKCILMENKSDDNQRADFFERNIMKKTLTYESVKVTDDTVYVNIWPHEDDNYQECEEITEICTKKFITEKENNFDEKKLFTKEEIDELYEEPLNTENALIAVQGYATDDDDRFCKFYDPKTGGCFKGAKCKKQHLPISNDGYECKDRMEIFIHKEDSDIIEIGKFYDIIITFINKFNNFIFRFNDPEYEIKLKEIQSKINDKHEIKTYKKISFEPEIGQLILAKIGGQFFRAKVYDYCKDNFVVWCLDDGLIKPSEMSSMYDLKMQFHDIKYLTHEMEISNIEPGNAKNKRAMMRISDIRSTSDYLQALITQTVPYFKCQLFDLNGMDIGKALIDEGFAYKNVFDVSVDYNSKDILPI